MANLWAQADHKEFDKFEDLKRFIGDNRTTIEEAAFVHAGKFLDSIDIKAGGKADPEKQKEIVSGFAKGWGN